MTVTITKSDKVSLLHESAKVVRRARCSPGLAEQLVRFDIKPGDPPALVMLIPDDSVEHGTLIYESADGEELVRVINAVGPQ